MKYQNLTKHLFALLVIVFLATLSFISADVAVTYIDRMIKIPAKKEKKQSRVKVSEEIKKELINYKDIFDKNIFKATIKDPNFFEKSTGKISAEDIEKEKIQELPPEPEVPKTPPIDASKYELYGTMVTVPKELSSATILNKNINDYEIYGLKEYNKYIDGIYEIINISRKSIEIKTDDGSVIINLVEEGKSVQPGGLGARPPVQREERAEPFRGDGVTKKSDNRFIIDQRLYESMTKDVSSLMSLQRQINFVPKLDENQKPIGFEIKRITPGSLFQKIGLLKGDVVKSVNGRVLNAMSVQEALSLLNEMKSETEINLDIKRGDADSTLGYEVR